MSLEDQISQIAVPQEFVRLCNAVFTAKYEDDYQVIDGTRGDEGNDGYVSSEKRVLAMYCPIKPERRTDNDYVEKIRSDVKKASELVASGRYAVSHWTFVTPRKLTSAIISKMKELASSHGLRANHIEATWLSNELQKYPWLLESFPTLHAPRIEEKLDEIIQSLRSSGVGPAPEEPILDQHRIYKGQAENKNSELDEILALRKAMPESDSKTKLRVFFYKSSDPVARINALLGVLDLFAPMDDDLDDLIELCDQGLGIAKELSDDGVRGHLLGQKGFLVSFKFSMEELEYGYALLVAKTVGIATLTLQEAQATEQRLRALHIAFTDNFNEALELSKNNYPRVLADVLLMIGNAAGMRYIHENTLRDALSASDRATADRRICKTALMSAKDIYSQLGDKFGATNALFNVANQIRFFGETDEALELVKETIERASSLDDAELLLAKAKALKTTLETGHVPDYLAGERRDWET